MAQLTDADRLNYFPASPLYTATLVLEGQLHVSREMVALDDLRDLSCAPKRLFQSPCIRPHTSWSPGPIMALTLAFYPDAWRRLGGSIEGEPPPAIDRAMSLLELGPLDGAWPQFWQALGLIWRQSAAKSESPVWIGSDRIKDWAHHLIGQLGQTGSGRSLRSTQRRLQRWTGQTKQSLEFFAKVEDVHRCVTKEPATTPPEIAADAGFADQSHMGRAIKRATGFPPARLNQKIATEEPFWCYRLLGERF
jgi:AraC-like DNA-binding protein